ncbi:hypothetical protein U27_04892 [Candidatus Vecturithrix granuli]|uniref:HepT-like domain-containing protein n=1 Tax=Vecturithrix granuli TaxID=1499967 RepID=A0A081C015_VECG1|nr:hypothetical protein U27_04892 [Candidatus Vecturithrix granuli]
MKEPMALRELIAELEKTLVILDRNVQFFQEFTHKDFPVVATLYMMTGRRAESRRARRRSLRLRSGNVHHVQDTTTDFPKLGQSTAAAMVYSQIFGDFYTSIETLFVRIAQTFENSIQSETWHKSLLHKMTLDIEGVRIAVISDATYNVLSEILRFRHFKRYYFDFDCD